ncbi:glycosyltransferase family 87 protein [Streptomyces sp. NPDC005706]|uniref:glycosyltransferase family 87 protein n=1 Tax=Streptomyces sp. NPDC005706 TaxID=3157169 RepID=UPI0033F0BA81
MKRTGGWPAALPWTWCATRLALLLLVFRVVSLPGADVTTDVSVIYQGWSEVLRQGTFPVNDVTWQYPPAAALAVLSPALLPFLGYAPAFFVLSCLADLVVSGLLTYAGRRPERSSRGAWIWVAGLPLLGPTAYARYDLMVTAVAVAALLAGTRYPRLMGALAGFAALLKVWPALLLVGAARLRAWLSAAVTAGGVAALFGVAMPGAFAFLAFQRDRGTEVESLGGLVLHVARRFGWPGEVVLNYGSAEFLGPYAGFAGKAAVALSAGALSWLLLWRLRSARSEPHTLADAAFTAVLLLTVTSRVISPQYLVWLIGLAAVCGCFPASRTRRPAALVLAAALVTLLEFPIGFAHVIASDTYGVALLLLRNALLLAAALTAARALWRATVPATTAPVPVSPADPARSRATGR